MHKLGQHAAPSGVLTVLGCPDASQDRVDGNLNLHINQPLGADNGKALPQEGLPALTVKVPGGQVAQLLRAVPGV